MKIDRKKVVDSAEKFAVGRFDKELTKFIEEKVGEKAKKNKAR